MSSERQDPTELIYLPRASWTPALLAVAVAAIVIGTYGEGFIFPGWVYSVAGAVLLVLALQSAVAGAVRDYFRMPRRQRRRSAVLPAASLRAPRSPES